MKLFSIITICLNIEHEIKRTILSVLEQDCDNFEYIIQDGGSTDQTVSIAESFISVFEERGIPFYIFSKHDGGIYNAMNIAAQQTHGEWVIYMNGGDCFAEATVLSQVIGNSVLENADVVYGDVIIRNNNYYRYFKAQAIENIRFGMPFCHQSVFTRKELLDARPFSVKYKVCSDYLFYLQWYYECAKFVYLPIAISIYDAGGISSDGNIVRREKVQIYEEMPIRDEEAIKRVKDSFKKITKKDLLRDHLKKFVPWKLRKMRCDYLMKKDGWKIEKDFFHLSV